MKTIYPWAATKVGEEFFVPAKNETLDKLQTRMNTQWRSWCGDPRRHSAYKFEVRQAPNDNGVIVRRVATDFTKHNALLSRPW